MAEISYLIISLDVMISSWLITKKNLRAVRCDVVTAMVTVIINLEGLVQFRVVVFVVLIVIANLDGPLKMTLMVTTVFTVIVSLDGQM